MRTFTKTRVHEHDDVKLRTLLKSLLHAIDRLPVTNKKKVTHLIASTSSNHSHKVCETIEQKLQHQG